MADRTVSVRLQAQVSSYMASMSAASKATAGLAREVDIAKGKTAQGFHAMGVAGVAVGAVVAGGFALAIKSAADFESKMALVRTLSHATAGQMSQLSDAALHVGQAYGFSAGEVADAQAELVKAGISVSDVLGGALTGALTLAAAGQTNVAEATQIAATAMTQFELKGKDVPHIADLLAAGADKALGSVGDLGYALDQAGPQAHSFRVSIEETVGTLAAFAQAGQVGERGGTVFAQVLAQLAAPSKQAQQIIDDLGLSVYDANGQFVGMASLAGQLHSQLSGLTQAERTHDLQVIFGQRAVRGANILYQEGAQGIRDWTDAVNDQGFAALQAAGKLDSLSGDVTKLKTALQAAFIGVGEGEQGPLRTMVQDVTAAVEAWNGLPGPVKASAEALVLAGGAVAFAGGAALLFIPKWTAMNAAIVASGRSAITARGALMGMSKVGAVALGLAAVYEGAVLLNGVLDETGPTVEDITADLINMGKQGSDSADKLINTLVGLSQVDFGIRGPNLDDWGKLTQRLDDALVGLVTNGHADLAAADFGRISTALHDAGLSTQDITKLLPGYARQLAESANQANLSADGVDNYGNAVGAAAKKTQAATDRAKAYSAALHALADPLFAMNQALQGVVDAQQGVNQAIHKYGADSPQARQANLDMASAALDAEAAARTLAASVKAGTTSLRDARAQLRAWVADGLITKQSADDVTRSFGYLIDKANAISNTHPHMTVTADTSQPEAALSHLIARIGAAISAFFTLDGVTVTGSGAHTTGPGSNPVGYQPPGSSTGRSGGHSGGGGTTVTIPPLSNDGYYVPPSSGGGGGSGGGSGGSRGGSGASGTRERPPTVQEIVHAILTGTIPPSIDKLSKTLQHEIGHLSTVVGNAEQYRSTVRSSLLGYASLSNATAPTDAYGRQMGAVKVNSYLKGRLSQLKQFVHLRHRLEQHGAGQALLQEFEEIGPDANPMMRQLLQGGRSAIRHANRLEHRIGHLAGQAATEAATDRYGKQIVDLLSRMPQEDARAIAKALPRVHIDVSLKDVAHRRARHVRNKS